MYLTSFLTFKIRRMLPKHFWSAFMASLPCLFPLTSISHVPLWSKAYTIRCQAKYTRENGDSCQNNQTRHHLHHRYNLSQGPQTTEDAWTHYSWVPAPESPTLPWFLFFLKSVCLATPVDPWAWEIPYLIKLPSVSFCCLPQGLWTRWVLCS